MPCWRSWCDSHSGHPGQVPTKTVSPKSPVTLRASVRRCQIGGALQTGRAPPSYRLLAVPRLFPQGEVPFPHAAPRCAWRFVSNTSAVVTRPSPRSHHARDRQREFGVLRSEEHTSELQSRSDLVCRLLLEKKKNYRDNKLLLSHSVKENLQVGAES